MSTSTVTPPVSFTYRALRDNTITWSLSDGSGNPVTGASVKATLWIDRSRTNPTSFPGTADTTINNLALPETSTAGTYSAAVPSTFNPPSATYGYVTQILAGGVDWEIPSVVVPAQDINDLVLLDDVKSYLNIDANNTNNDLLLQLLISSFTTFVLNRTSMSSFSQPQTYTEIYDGNNNMRLMLRNYPILSLTSVLVGAYTVPLSTGVNVPGIYIDGIKRSIAFRNAPFFWPNYSVISATLFPYSFVKGQGNIQVQYTAGYTQVPYDLQDAAMRAVAIYYKRRNYLDLDSNTLSAGAGVSGTVRYRSWDLPPEINKVISFYSRYSPV